MTAKRKTISETIRENFQTVLIVLLVLANGGAFLGTPSCADLQTKAEAATQHSTIDARVSALKDGIEELKRGQQAILERLLRGTP